MNKIMKILNFLKNNICELVLIGFWIEFVVYSYNLIGTTQPSYVFDNETFVVGSFVVASIIYTLYDLSCKLAKKGKNDE